MMQTTPCISHRTTQLQHYRKLALFIASRTTIPAALQRPQSSQLSLLLLWAVAELVCGRSLWAAFVGGRRAESGDGILLVAEIYAKETRLADLPTPRTRINTTYMIQEACSERKDLRGIRGRGSRLELFWGMKQSVPPAHIHPKSQKFCNSQRRISNFCKSGTRIPKLFQISDPNLQTDPSSTLFQSIDWSVVVWVCRSPPG